MNVKEIRRTNLKALREQYKPMRMFADAVGMTDSYVSQLCSGNRPITEETAAEIEKLIGLPPGRLSLEDDSMLGEAVATSGFGQPLQFDTLQIKQFESKLSREPSVKNEDDQVKERLTFKRSWIEKMNLNPQELVSVNVRGNSMGPRIANGDTVLVRTDDKRLSDGVVYAINYDGDARCKRIERKVDGGIVLKSDNYNDPNGAPEVIPQDMVEQINVIGAVVAVSGLIV